MAPNPFAMGIGKEKASPSISNPAAVAGQKAVFCSKAARFTTHLEVADRWGLQPQHIHHIKFTGAFGQPPQRRL